MTRPVFGQGPGPGPGPAGLAWPAGRPAEIREAARRVVALGEGVDDIATRTEALVVVEGWTGPPAIAWEEAVAEHAVALGEGGGPLVAAGRALHDLADEMVEAREAIGRLAEEVLDAEAVADRAARHAVEVRRTWIAGLGLAPGGPPPARPPERVATADAAALAAADEADAVLRRCLTRSRARRDEVRSRDRRAAALLDQAVAAAPVEGEVAWCGTTAGPRGPRGPRGPHGQPVGVVESAWAPAGQWHGAGGGGRPPAAWQPAPGPGADLAWQTEPAQAGAEPARWQAAPGDGGRRPVASAEPVDLDGRDV